MSTLVTGHVEPGVGIAMEKKGDRKAALKESYTAVKLLPLDAGLQNRYERLAGGTQNSVDKNISKAGVAGPIATVGGDVSPPIPIYKPDPEYSERARQAKIGGTVSLWTTIDPEGNVADTTITKPLGLGLDAKALETIRTWKFKPATRSGTPVPVRVMVEINFKLF